MATASSQGSEYPSPQESPRTSPSPSISLPSNAPKAATEDSGSGPVVGLGTASPVPELNDAGTRSARRERELPRDERGRPFCDHPDCQPSKPTFVRRCEWNKHMDKHERPYRCKEAGCEKLRGFTYSGGLLRHEREVHRKHGGPKKPLMCPHLSCKRSGGSGFTRQENLNEHLRRVHQKAEVEEHPPEPTSPSTGKRKRGWVAKAEPSRSALVSRVRDEDEFSDYEYHDDDDNEDKDGGGNGGGGGGGGGGGLGGDEVTQLRREMKRLRQETDDIRVELRLHKEMLARLEEANN